MTNRRNPGAAAVAEKGWLSAHRNLLLRRASQLVFLVLFLSGPVLGIWIVKGTLNSSLTLGVLPLTDPFFLLQSIAARHWPAATALLGGGIVLAAYLVLGGRSYCAWVCPINPVTDLAAWIRRRTGYDTTAKLRPELRRWILAAVVAVSALTGIVGWELVNPITALHRALLFGLWFGLAGAAAIFVFDLLVAKHGWCGHLCPVGAFYGGLGRASLLRISARGRGRCNDCMDCYAVCPEPRAIAPALRAGAGEGPLILSGDCTLCGRCADVCPTRVFAYTHRFDRRVDAAPDAGAALAREQAEIAA